MPPLPAPRAVESESAPFALMEKAELVDVAYVVGDDVAR